MRHALLLICLLCSSAVAQTTLVFRSHDPSTGYYYEIRCDEDFNRFAHVYQSRSAALGKYVFKSEVNIYSVFHTPDTKYLIINHGSGSYGNVAVVFSHEAGKHKPFISESSYRSMVEAGLQKVHPEFVGWNLYHLYAPIRDVRGTEAILYASGDFIKDKPDGDLQQKQFKGVFLGIDLISRKARLLEENEELKTWFRGLSDSDASYGSGFFISERHILTNAHVVKEAKRVSVGYGNRESWAEVVARSDKFDLAIVMLPESAMQGIPVPLANTAPELGEKVRAFGYPLPSVQGFTIKLTEGNISGKFGLRDNPLHFQCTAPIQPGNSGGALLNDKNELIGVAVATLNKVAVAEATGHIAENVNLGIHLDVVREFLSEQKFQLKRNEQQKFNPDKSCVQIISHK